VAGADEFRALDGDLDRIVGDLQRAGAQLERAVAEAAGRSYEIVSSDGLVRVTVDGRGRFTALYLGPHLLRQGPDEVDRRLTATLNEALDVARRIGQQALLDRLPPSLRQVLDAAREYSQ
jgi:DNA-binding protein YbaB